MKKLDKYQVKALACDIVTKARAENAKLENLLRKDKKLQKRVNEIFKLVEKIPTEVRRKLYWEYSPSDTKARILNALLDTSKLKTVKSQFEIENEIVIASIDAEDMNSIVKAINAFK